MPVGPYPVSGKVYDETGTALENATVTLYDVTNHEWLPSDARVTTNALGEYTLDLANFKTDYANGNTILIIAWDSNSIKVAGGEHTVATATGSWEKDLYMHLGKPFFGNCVMIGYIITNDQGSEKYVDLYDIYDGNRKLRVHVAASSTISESFGKGRGIFFTGGIIPICETETAFPTVTVILDESVGYA